MPSEAERRRLREAVQDNAVRYWTNKRISDTLIELLDSLEAAAPSPASHNVKAQPKWAHAFGACRDNRDPELCADCQAQYDEAVLLVDPIIRNREWRQKTSLEASREIIAVLADKGLIKWR